MLSNIQTLHLGDLSLKHAKSALQLRASVSVKLTGPNGGRTSDSATPTQELTVESLQDAWVSRGAGLRLVLEFDGLKKFDSVCDGTSNDASIGNALVDNDSWNDVSSSSGYTEHLAGRLEKAELWAQLGLRVTAIDHHDANNPPLSTDHPRITSASNKGVAIIELSLNHIREQHPEAQERTVYRLCYGISPADIRPPTGIDVFEMVEVRLQMDFQRLEIKRNSRKRKRVATNIVDQPWSQLSSDLNSLDTLFEEQEEEAERLRFLHGVDSGYNSLASSQDSMGLEDSQRLGLQEVQEHRQAGCIVPLLGGEHATMLLEDKLCVASSIEQLAASDACLSLLPRISTHMQTNRSSDAVESAKINNIDVLNAHPDAGALLQRLVDAALRLSLHSKPTRLMTGLKMDQDVPFPSRLSKLAPSLWSPDYGKAISTRAPLIATIAHVFSHSLYKNSRSQSLKLKIDRLVNRNQPQPPSTGGYNMHIVDGAADILGLGQQDRPTAPYRKDSSQQQDCRFRAISAELWKLIARGLYREDAAKRVKPLDGHPNPNAPQKQLRKTSQDKVADPPDCTQGGEENDDVYLLDLEHQLASTSSQEKSMIEINSRSRMDDDMLFENDFRMLGEVPVIEMSDDDLLLEDRSACHQDIDLVLPLDLDIAWD